MDFEIEFHPVGGGSRAGDAITVRYEAEGVYKIIVIDGGTDESGDKLVEHINKHLRIGRRDFRRFEHAP